RSSALWTQAWLCLIVVLRRSRGGGRLQVQRRRPQVLPLLGQLVAGIRGFLAHAAADAALQLRAVRRQLLGPGLVQLAQVVSLADAVVDDVPGQYFVAPAAAEQVEARVERGGLH